MFSSVFGVTGVPTDDDIVDLILIHEGGTFTDDPDDAGGPTKYGITMPVLSKWLNRRVTALDIDDLTREDAAAIYRAMYVAPFAPLPDPLRVNVIDMGVNAGQTRACKLLQQLIGASVDGVLGPETTRLAKVREWNPLYVGIRIGFYESLIEQKPTQRKWRNGWRNRALSFLGKPVSKPSIRTLLSTGSSTEKPSFGFMGKAL